MNQPIITSFRASGGKHFCSGQRSNYTEAAGSLCRNRCLPGGSMTSNPLIPSRKT